MNTSIIRYIVGYILKIEAALLLIPSGNRKIMFFI